jgi:hypothetical protein
VGNIDKKSQNVTPFKTNPCWGTPWDLSVLAAVAINLSLDFSDLKRKEKKQKILFLKGGQGRMCVR